MLGDKSTVGKTIETGVTKPLEEIINTIEGVDELHPIEHAIIPDRVEAGTLLVVSHDRRFLDALRSDRVIELAASWSADCASASGAERPGSNARIRCATAGRRRPSNTSLAWVWIGR